MKRRVVTGLGIASALGTSTEEFFAAFKSGAPEKALANRPPLTSFDASRYDSPPITEVPSFDPTIHLGDKGLRTLDRLTKLLVVAARLALHDAGLKKDNAFLGPLGPTDIGVCCSNAYGSLEAITELDRVAVLEDARYINPAKFPNTVSNSAAGYVSIWEDLRALNVSVSDGNCGGLDAVSCADIFLETKRASVILTGGGESMSEALYLAFDKLGVLGVQVPGFTKTRLGEGAAFLALEPEELADKRGAKKLAVITGYGTAFIGPKDDVTLLFASSASLERAIASALEDAGVQASDVDLVVSGMAGIERMDKVERSAIETAIRSDIAIAAPKHLFGESLGAGGALAMAAALTWLDGAPPSCLVAGTAPAKVETVLVTSMGYYGNASALIMRRPSSKL